MNGKTASSKVSHDRWLVSYADFITLLFAFFVVLYAFAKADEKKQIEVSAAIESGFRTLSIASATHVGEAQALSRKSRPEKAALSTALLVAEESTEADLEHIQNDLEQRLAIEIAKGTVAVGLGSDGLVISLREAGFFNSGSALPKPETFPILIQVADALTGTPYDVRIEGHTDNIYIRNASFDSNWELSSARAVGITRMFLQLHAIAPERLSAAGFGQYRPIADNNTAEGRAQNRRVDIVVMPRVVLAFPNLGARKDQTKWRRITDP